jgi:hypothetical protein
MVSFDAFDTKASRLRRCGTEPARDVIVHADPAKAFVLACISQLVVDGHARWLRLDNGDIRLTFNTGETFLLANAVIVRVA